MRRVLSVVAMLIAGVGLFAVASPVGAADLAPVVAKFLTDPQVPSDLVASPPQKLEDGTLRHQIYFRGTEMVATLVLSPDQTAVVSFESPGTRFPVTDTVVSKDAAIEAAKESARKWRPELLAAGEVTADVDDEVTRTGGYAIHLRQRVNGTLTLTRADLQVALYDGKVIAWEASHSPLAVATGTTLTADQAQEIAAGKIPYDNFEPMLWMDRVNEIVVDKEGKQHNVWTVWAEIKTKNTQNKIKLESFAQWWIDAKDGTIIKAEAVPVSSELYWRYLGKGGTRVPQNGPLKARALFADRAPAYSPDGTKIAFLSSRARPGYPAYMDRPAGLFLMDATGANLRCLRPEATRWFRWSPDGKQIVVGTWEKTVALLDAEGKPLATFAGEKGLIYDRAAWAPDGKLVLGVVTPMGEGFVALLDPAHPEAKPVALPAPFDRAVLGDAALSPDGKTLAVAAMNMRDFTWQLYLLPAVDPTAKTTQEPKSIPDGQSIQWLDGQTLLVSVLDRGTWLAQEMFKIDVATGNKTRWQFAQTVLDTEIEKPYGIKPQGLAFSPDGKQLVFPSPVWDYNPRHHPATILYGCAPDGTGLKRLTPWGGDTE